MINQVKRSLITLWKLHKIESIIYILTIVLFPFYLSLHSILPIIILIVGMFLFSSFKLVKRIYVDKYRCYFYINPPLSNRGILFQNSKKCKYECQEVMASLLSKKKIEEIISQLPKGKYKSITHSSVINAIKTFDNEIYISKAIYNDKLSNIRKRLLGKECPCSDSIDCKYRKYILSSQEHKDTTDFYYIEFTIK